MNKTQKEAIFSLAGTLFGALLISYLFITLFIFKIWPAVPVAYLAVTVFVTWITVFFIFLRKKQSPAEPDSDERDNIIKQKAVLTSFVSVGILLYAVSIIPWLIVGQAGSIPVCVLPFINLGVFLIATLIYNIAILIQYGRGDKDGSK